MHELATTRVIIRELTRDAQIAVDVLLSKEFDFYYGPFDENPDMAQRLNWIVSLTKWKAARGDVW